MLVVALLTLLAASPAQAATVTAGQYSTYGKYENSYDGTELTVTASPGEANVLTMTADPEGFTIRDTGAAPAAGVGCIQVAGDEVRCSRKGVRGRPDKIVIDLGDGDDRLDTTGVATVFAHLGAGDDVASAGPAFDWLHGDGGSDELHGGPGPDILDGGDDVEPDTLDGGDGIDVAAFSAAWVVSRDVDLMAGTGFFGDTLQSVEAVDGGSGDDVLLGSDGADYFVGRGSRHGDVIDGRGGDDVLDGYGPGPDRVTGGPGDDQLRVPSGGSAEGGPGDDRIGSVLGGAGRALRVGLTCGPGRDVAEDFWQALPPDCEVAGIGDLGTFDRPRLAGGAVLLRARHIGPACRITLRVEDGRGRALTAWRRSAFVAGMTRRWSLRLTRPARGDVLGLQVRTHACRRKRYAAPAERVVRFTYSS